MPLTLRQSQKLIAAAQEHAKMLGVNVTVAVVDEGGHMLALAKMDGAMPLSSQIAEAKAVGAAMMNRDGDQLAQILQDRPAFFEMASSLTRVPLVGGLGSRVIRKQGAVLGAVGVSGAKPEQDHDCARAGLEAIGLSAS